MSSVSSSAIAEFYFDHHHWLQGWLRKKLGCPHHAADLAHDTFMRLLRPGERAMGTDASASEPKLLDQAAQWFAVLRDESVTDAELARHTPVPLAVAPDAGALRLVGVYRIADPALDVPRILAALEAALPVRVSPTAAGGMRIEAR